MTTAKKKDEIEIERKIKLSPRDMEKVFNHFSEKAEDDTFRQKYYPRPYFDTERLTLFSRNVSVRVQYTPGKNGKPGRYKMTLKHEASPMKQSIMYRAEIPVPLRSHVPDLGRIRSVRAQRLLKGVSNRSLMHLFTASVERRCFYFKTAKGTVEMAFDRGDIHLPFPSRRRIPLCEVELELKKGTPEAIEEVTRTIMKTAPKARIQKLSKAQQGTRLYMKANKIKLK